MATTVFVFLAALVALGAADPSPACGTWTSGCVEDQLSHVFVNRSLTMLAATYPADPTADFEGTFGSYTSQNLIFANNSCSSGAHIATVWLFGSWIDNGPAQWPSYRQIGVSYQSMKVKPMTQAAVNTLVQLCPCDNINTWQLGQMRTITMCSGACEIPWVNFSNVGHPHYGVVTVSNGNNVMNMSEFTPTATYTDNTTLFTLSREDQCPPLTTFTELCGDFSQECRPSSSLPLNMRVSFQLLGNAAGTFKQSYEYFNLSDVNCSQTAQASYVINGNYALHGPKNCSGQCQNAVGIELFAQSSSFLPASEQSVKELNDNCPCNGTWTINMPRVITVCPAGTCTSLDLLEFSHGIPAGTSYQAFGNLLPHNDYFMAITSFTRVDDYENEFKADDFAFYGDFTTACSTGKTDSTLECGQYITKCSGSPDRFANYVENVTLFGPGPTGVYRRHYQQFEMNDLYCQKTPQVEYIVEGTYSIDGAGVCPDCSAMGVYSKIEISVTRTQITANNNNSLDALKTSCPCGRLAWKIGQPFTITTCPIGECLLETFPGIQGLSIGTVQPLYGTITKFGNFMTMTDVSSVPATGYSLPFTTSSHILYVNDDYQGCKVPPQNTLVCGTYTDGCRGGTANSDNDNLIRVLTLTGEQFGQFTVTQYLYLGFDTDCTNNTLNGHFDVYGMYALRGPSKCGGSCAGLGAQQIEMSTGYAVGTFYNPQYIDFLQEFCPCNGTWSIAKPRTLVECAPGTCLVDIRGLPLGSGTPVYGSLLRFGDIAMITDLSLSDTAGYSNPFSSLDQPYFFDQSSTGANCPTSPVSNLCGVYRTPCTAYSGNETTFEMQESISFSGTTSGSFTKVFKAYSITQSQSCGAIVLQQWEITGSYAITGASNCGGTCTNANTTSFSVQQAKITLTSQSDVDKFNSLCKCGEDWVVGKTRIIGTSCDHCALYTQQAAHGLDIGTPFASFGSVKLESGSLSLTRFSANPVVGYTTPFEPRTDRVFSIDTASSAGLDCAAASPSSSSDSGLTAGDGLLIAFFCILAVYLIGGMLLNYRSGATGQELIPHLSFWKSIPGLVAAGFRFSFVDCFGLRGDSAATDGYKPIAPTTSYGATATA